MLRAARKLTGMARMVEKIVEIKPSAIVSMILPAWKVGSDAPGLRQTQAHQEIGRRLRHDGPEDVAEVLAGRPCAGSIAREEIGVDDVVEDFERVAEARNQAVEPHVGHLPRDDVDDQSRQQQTEGIQAALAVGQTVGIKDIPGPKKREQDKKPTGGDAAQAHLGDSEIIQRPRDQVALRQRGQQDQHATLALAQVELPCAGDNQRKDARQ